MGYNHEVRFLLDSHVVDWAQSDPARLSVKVRNLLADSKPGDLAISDVSLAELARLLRSGTIRPNVQAEEWLNAATEGVVVLPVTAAIALFAAYLEWDHRDPCDRQIVATAIEHNLTLLSIDERIRALRVPVLKVVW